MTRKTATAVKDTQPDLLGKVAASIEEDPKTKAKQQVSKAEPQRRKTAAVALVQPPEPKTLVDRLRQISDGKDVAIAKEILTMIREEESLQARRAFNGAMLECQSQIPPITRDSFNKHTKSKWAKLEKISRIADPIIRKNGFTLSYGMATSPLPDHYRVVCDVSHVGGDTRRYDADVGMDSKGPKGEGNKSLAQGSGSSVTYARRYLKVMVFDIVIDGEDNDGNGSRVDKVIESGAMQMKTDVPANGEQVDVCSEDQLMKVRDAIAGCGVSDKTFCKHFQIEKVSQLPAASFKDALEACKNYDEKRKGA